MANNNKQFIFVKDMPFGESTIKQNTRLTYYNGYINYSFFSKEILEFD